MRSFKAAFLVAVLAALTVMMAASAAVAREVAEEVDDKTPVETFSSAEKVPAGILPGSPRKCTIRVCGSRCVRRTAVVYYWWYSATSLSVGSSTGEGGTIIRRCTRTRICPACVRCLARKYLRVCMKVPIFCKVLPFASAKTLTVR